MYLHFSAEIIVELSCYYLFDNCGVWIIEKGKILVILVKPLQILKTTGWMKYSGTLRGEGKRGKFPRAPVYGGPSMKKIMDKDCLNSV